MSTRNAPRAKSSQSPRRPRKTSRPGRPHLVALPGGKSRDKHGKKGSKNLKRRRTDKRGPRFVSSLFMPLSRPLSSSGFRFVATASAVLMAFIFGLVMLHILSAQASFRLEGLHERVAREEARYRKMRYDVAQSESPARIADAAKNLGMVPPAERRYIVGSEVESKSGSHSEKQRLSEANDGEMKAVLSQTGGR